jgi:hypothetical protein
VQNVVPKVAAGIVVRTATSEPLGQAGRPLRVARGEDFDVAQRLP